MHLGLVYVIDDLAVKLSGWNFTESAGFGEGQASSQGLCHDRRSDGSLAGRVLHQSKTRSLSETTDSVPTKLS